jgi:hypothetical protein
MFGLWLDWSDWEQRKLTGCCEHVIRKMPEISWQLLRRDMLREVDCYIELPKCLLRVVYASKFSVRLPLLFFSLLLTVPILMSSVRHLVGKRSDLSTGWYRIRWSFRTPTLISTYDKLVQVVSLIICTYIFGFPLYIYRKVFLITILLLLCMRTKRNNQWRIQFRSPTFTLHCLSCCFC